MAQWSMLWGLGASAHSHSWSLLLPFPQDGFLAVCSPVSHTLPACAPWLLLPSSWASNQVGLVGRKLGGAIGSTLPPLFGPRSGLWTNVGSSGSMCALQHHKARQGGGHPCPGLAIPLYIWQLSKWGRVFFSPPIQVLHASWHGSCGPLVVACPPWVGAVEPWEGKMTSLPLAVAWHLVAAGKQILAAGGPHVQSHRGAPGTCEVLYLPYKCPRA